MICLYYSEKKNVLYYIILYYEYIKGEPDKDDFAIKVEAYLSLEEFTIKDDNGR